MEINAFNSLGAMVTTKNIKKGSMVQIRRLNWAVSFSHCDQFHCLTIRSFSGVGGWPESILKS